MTLNLYCVRGAVLVVNFQDVIEGGGHEHLSQHMNMTNLLYLHMSSSSPEYIYNSYIIYIYKPPFYFGKP